MTDAGRSDPGKLSGRTTGSIDPPGNVCARSAWDSASCSSWRSRGSTPHRPGPCRPAVARREPVFPEHRPGVRYVGDAACPRCHAEIAGTYRRHPMGRSLDLAGRTTIPGRDSASFQARGLEYSVERRGDRVFHKEIKRDACRPARQPGRGGSPLRNRIR